MSLLRAFLFFCICFSSISSELKTKITFSCENHLAVLDNADEITIFISHKIDEADFKDTKNNTQKLVKQIEELKSKSPIDKIVIVKFFFTKEFGMDNITGLNQKARNRIKNDSDRFSIFLNNSGVWANKRTQLFSRQNKKWERVTAVEVVFFNQDHIDAFELAMNNNLIWQSQLFRFPESAEISLFVTKAEYLEGIKIQQAALTREIFLLKKITDWNKSISLPWKTKGKNYSTDKLKLIEVLNETDNRSKQLGWQILLLE